MARGFTGGDALGGVPDPNIARRQAAMQILSQAKAEELATGLEVAGQLPPYTVVRPVEAGLVMVRGRVGGDGAPFNLGEATVTRAAVRIESGEIGVSYALGRDTKKAELAALCDALLQSDAYRGAVEQHVLAPVRTRVEDANARAHAQTAATRVEFFTMVRGED